MRHPLIGALPLLVLLVMPALHGGAWAHQGSDAAAGSETHVAAGGDASLADSLIECSLCLALSQSRSTLLAPTPAATEPGVPAAGDLRAGVTAPPATPDPGVRGPRAPPAC